MNDRILDLAIQAKDWAYADHDGYTAQMLFEQKFAQLIVEECAEQVKNLRVNDYGISGAEIIREHFGVEV